MFFQALIYVILILIALWIAWKFIVRPILEANGIEVEEEVEEEIKTSYTEKLVQLQKTYAEKSESARAAAEGLELARDIKFLEDRIEESNSKMKEI